MSPDKPGFVLSPGLDISAPITVKTRLHLEAGGYYDSSTEAPVLSAAAGSSS